MGSCVRIPPPPPDIPLNYEYVAPIGIAGSSRFYRFDLPPSAQAWKGVKAGYQRLSVFDSNGLQMRCGPVDFGTPSMAYRVTRTLIPLSRMDDDSVAACTASNGAPVTCVRDKQPGDVLYEMQFDAVPDVNLQPYPALNLTWNHPPTMGGSVLLLDDAGRVTAQDSLGNSGRGKNDLQQETRLAVRFHEPRFHLIVRTRDRTLVLTSVELTTGVSRTDGYAHWFEASGTPPYSLYFNWKRGNCVSGQITDSELPTEAATDDWPPVVEIGAAKTNPRNLLEKFRGDLDPAWWLLLEAFIPAWLIGMILGFLFRLFSRRRN